MLQFCDKMNLEFSSKTLLMLPNLDSVSNKRPTILVTKLHKITETSYTGGTIIKSKCK